MDGVDGHPGAVAPAVQFMMSEAASLSSIGSTHAGSPTVVHSSKIASPPSVAEDEKNLR